MSVRRTVPYLRWVGVVLAAGVLAVGAGLAGCSPQDGDAAAGSRVAATADSGDLAGDPGGASPAAIAAARLRPCPSGDPSATAAPDGLPDVVLQCLGDGPDVRLSELRGTPIVVNVWAPWCLPCRSELPMLAEVAGRAGSAVQFLGVDIKDPSPDDALRLLAGSGVRYPTLSDYSGTTRPGLRWSGPPMTVLVRADGTIAYRKVGELASADELRRLIAEHLGVAVPA